MDNEREKESRIYKFNLGKYIRSSWLLCLDCLGLYIICDSLAGYTILKTYGEKPGIYIYIMADQPEVENRN